MRTVFANFLFRLFGHRICCGRIPQWLCGKNWDTVDVKPWNPYNIVWRMQNTLRWWMD